MTATDSDLETIEFAGFLSDFDVSVLCVMTYCESKKVSYIKVLKIEKKEPERSYSLVADKEKAEFVETVKTNLLEQGVDVKVKPGNDNVQVTVDTTKQTLKVTKRGASSIQVKADGVKELNGVTNN